jgi:hypothetical protein
MVLQSTPFGTTIFTDVGGGHGPNCQTVYAHYLLHLQDLDVAHKKEIEAVYTNITQAAIHNGMLEDSLREVDPQSYYFVEGTGFRLTPVLHHHNDNNIMNEQGGDTAKHSPYHHRYYYLRTRKLKKPCTGNRFLEEIHQAR